MIRITAIHKAFGARPVLRGVSAVLAPGRVTAVLGPNGSGKTTLLKMLLGLVRPDAGTLEVNGRVLDGSPAYRADVGYMPQVARFPENLSGREIIAMLEDLRGSRGACDRQLLEEFELEGDLDKPVRTLSGGTRQKISAAAAFLFRPSVIILDEPTAGLDPIASGVLKAKIRDTRAAGATVVLTSHVLAEVEELADDVVVLLDGEVLAAGMIPELRLNAHEPTLERAIARLMLRRASQMEAA